jgi:hypothetical protein
MTEKCHPTFYHPASSPSRKVWSETTAIFYKFLIVQTDRPHSRPWTPIATAPDVSAVIVVAADATTTPHDSIVVQIERTHHANRTGLGGQSGLSIPVSRTQEHN